MSTDNLLSKGGTWLGAARRKIQWIFMGNGSRVTWGSNDVLSPHATVANVEQVAAAAVEADRQERDAELAALRARVAELEGLLGDKAPLLRQCAMRIGGRIRENQARMNGLEHLDPKPSAADLDTYQELVCAANKAASDIEAAKTPGLPEGARVWGVDDICTYFRLWDCNRMWARKMDEPGGWFLDSSAHTPGWADKCLPELHGPEALAVWEDWKAREQ